MLAPSVRCITLTGRIYHIWAMAERVQVREIDGAEVTPEDDDPTVVLRLDELAPLNLTPRPPRRSSPARSWTRTW